jgi:hypothetical protein
VIHKSTGLWIVVCLTLAAGLLAGYAPATAAQFDLSWSDNSDNEIGFKIERRIGSGGSYQQHATVGPNISSYADANLAASTTYCYRISAFNASGSSSYSNENCATVPAASYVLAVSRAGSGAGTVSSAPSGISCGADCNETYANGSVVTLTAIAAAGSVFSGWSGDADCADGRVTVTAGANCTATFNLISGYALTTSVVREMTSSSQAAGRIVSSPAGIDCGADCAETYAPNTVVALTPVAAANSRFTGWSGHSDCSDGSVTMNAAKNCTANFALNTVTLIVSTNGQGTVTSTPTGISCAGHCSYSFASGTTVSLRAAAAAGSTFGGWTGAGCTGTGDCNLTLSSAATVTANFSENLALHDRIGIYRPATGEWFLDHNGNGGWDGCQIDVCAQPFAGTSGAPVVGKWNASAVTLLGLFVAELSEWRVDANRNGIWEGCEIDVCLNYGRSGDLPVVGKWTVDSDEGIGVFRRSEKRWRIDINSNETLDRCTVDKCPEWSVYKAGDVPVAGDWTGRGTTQLGLYRPSTGAWYLDGNGNRTWNKCTKEICFRSFGVAGDIPVSGDWSGTGTSKIGVFRPSTGEWFLDSNGNGQWDGASVDLYLPAFGQDGDVPVVGRW